MSKNKNKNTELSLPSQLTKPIGGINPEQMSHIINYKMAQVEQELDAKEDVLAQKIDDLENQREELRKQYAEIHVDEIQEKFDEIEDLANKLEPKVDWKILFSGTRGEHDTRPHRMMEGYLMFSIMRHGGPCEMTPEEIVKDTAWNCPADVQKTRSIVLVASIEKDKEVLNITKTFSLEIKGAEKLAKKYKKLKKRIQGMRIEINTLRDLKRNTSKMERQLKAEISKQVIKAGPDGEKVIADLDNFEIPALASKLKSLKHI